MRERLRILQVVNVRWFNATAWYGLSLACLLRDAGHEVRVLGLPGTESFAKAGSMGLDCTPLDLNTANPSRIPSLLRAMSALLREFNPQVVNCHRGEGLVLWGLCKAAGHSFALIRTRGDQRPPKGNAVNRALHGRLVDGIIATNSRTARQCRELLGLGADKVHTIYGGVDRRRFAPDPAGRERVRRAYGFAPTDMVIGLLGRFDAVKGQKELIEALSLVRAARGPVEGHKQELKLMLLGFPTSVAEEQVREWLRQYGLSRYAVITGKVDDVAAHINAMDLGVIASQGSEAIARAAFEIMSCGVPLVGTDVGVMPDLLPPEALVPAGRGEALTFLLKKCVADPAFLLSLREEQQVRMQDLSNDCFLEQTLGVYRAVLQNYCNIL